MRKITLEQSSPEWLTWRKTLLTATDSAALMGVSPYATPYQCWQRKLGLLPEQKRTEAMDRGIRDEPIARQAFIDEYKINMTPCCIESDQYNFLGASLDGMSDCGKYLLEIKSQVPCSPPDHHIYQMQHQLLCTDSTAEMCYYVSYFDGEIDVHEIYPDPEWVKNYLIRAQEFWKGIVFFEAPALSSRDYKDMSDSPNFITYAQRYVSINDQIKSLEEKKEILRQEIITLCNDQSSVGAGIKVLKKNVKGRVDYDSIPELSTINLDKYRKSPGNTWTIMIDQK